MRAQFLVLAFCTTSEALLDPRIPGRTPRQREGVPLSIAFPTDPAKAFGDFGLISRERRNRAYASVSGFKRIASGDEVTASDLLPPPPTPGDEVWLSGGYRIAVVLGSAIAFPLLLLLLGIVLPDEATGISVLASSFTPGVSILFGTLLSLTVSIQYSRLQRIQDLAASESADICLLTRIVLGVFSTDSEFCNERRSRAAAALAEQVSTLVQRSRQDELLQIAGRDRPIRHPLRHP
jgi:hypothetical protein